MKDINALFNLLRQHDGAIWMEDEHIKLSTPKALQNQELKDFIIQHKKGILRMLKENYLLSKESFLHKIILKDEEATTYPLSFAQQRLWFIEQFEEGSNAYHMPELYELKAGTNIAGIKYALQKVVSRHEILRSTIEQAAEKEGLIQVVHHRLLLMEHKELTTDALEATLKAEINRPFDLSAAYPIRVVFYCLPEKTLMLINIHHIASDGWSTEILSKELLAYYQAYCKSDWRFCLPEPEVQYKDFAKWQRSYLSGPLLEKQLNYWKEKLDGHQRLELPADYTRPGRADFKGAKVNFSISEEVSRKLRALTRQCGTTLHSTMLSALNILLGKYSGQKDIITGSPAANRQYEQTRDLIGFFINMQVNRILLKSGQNFKDLIQEVQESQTDAQLHQDLPFEHLVDALSIDRDTSRHPLFQVMFVVQNFSSEEETEQYWIPLSLEGHYEVEKFDLSVYIDDSQESLSVSFSYATSLFAESSIRNLGKYYLYLLQQLSDFPEQSYEDFSLLSPEEQQHLLYDRNDTGQTCSSYQTLSEQFRKQVELNPEKIALITEDQQFSYREVDQKSNQLARYIRWEFQQRTGKIPGPDTLIALYLERSVETLVGIFAVLKAGAAYVPMDINYPAERISYMLEDTQVKLILTQARLKENAHPALPQEKMICIDLNDHDYLNEEYDYTDAQSHLHDLNKATDLAYVMYTSGTTGKPKGVMISHEAILSLVNNDYLKTDAQDVFMFLSSPVFDAATFEVFSSLLNGCSLFIPKDVKDLASDIPAFKAALATHKVSTLFLTKTLFESLYFLDNSLFSGLKYLLVGGEAVDKAVINKVLQEEAGPKNFLAVYGPTESTTFTTTYSITGQLSGNSVPIGKPINHRKVYLLDEQLRPVPAGVTAELYIAGAGLSRNYLHQEKLSEERFILNPYATAADLKKGHTKMYKTGDLVRWLSDGNIEFIGRNDDQVKIRGFRIELNEVANALMEIPGIAQSCVLVKENRTAAGNNKYLVGYYVALEKEKALSSQLLLEKLSEVLPEYMRPLALVEMDSFPYTLNGKLDKNAFPEPDLVIADHYVKPATATEISICNIWQEILGLRQVGLTDDFFRIGGNSILALQVAHLMSKALKRHVKVSDIFRFPSISKLLTHTRDVAQLLIPRNDLKEAALSFAQDRLWFIEQYEEGTNAYHMPEAYELAPDTDVAGITYALQQIVSRHEILRTTLEHGSEDGQEKQVVHEDPLQIEEVTVSAENFESMLRQDINRPFKLSNAYPIRVSLYRIGHGKAEKKVLLINIHHIASDGWSTEIFRSELFSYYEAYRRKDFSFSLPDLEIQYKDYAIWQRAHLTGTLLENQLNYWKEKLSGHQQLELPVDFPRPSQMDHKGAAMDFSISKETSEKLRKLAKKHDASMHSVMLSSVNILLGKYSGQEDIIIGSPIANRHYGQTQALIGFFVNMLVNRTVLAAGQSYEALIRQIHREQVIAQMHQDLPFEKLVDELSIDRDTSRHPLFQVSFVVQSFGNPKNSDNQQQQYLKPFKTEYLYDATKFDCSIYIDDSQEEMRGCINYATALYTPDTISQLIKHYLYLLDQLADSPEKSYSKISLLNAEEFDQLVYDWNRIDEEYPRDGTIQELFEKQAALRPDKIALVYGEQEFSYQMLNEKSNQLARHLRSAYLEKTKQELPPDTLIALYTDRSIEMVIGILAILKAGAAYVPLDINHPQDRISYILEDTNATFILSTKPDFSDQGIELPADKLICIALEECCYQHTDRSNLAPCSSSEHLAYIIYTSGTTGKPKGVMQTHGNVVRLFSSTTDQFQFNENDVWTLFHSYAFDFSVWELWGALCYGGKLIVVSNEQTKDLEDFFRLCHKHQVSVLNQTPSAFYRFADIASQSAGPICSLRYIIFGGEALNSYQLRTWWSYQSLHQLSTRLINMYGITETTVHVTFKALHPDDTVSSNIGKPIADLKAYVLDANFNPQPIGVAGELYVGGAGLAKGYLNHPELSLERFIPDPFATAADQSRGHDRIYKTGDLVRWLTNGDLEYLGRNDDQVKIRGYRIEPGEIEHALSQIKGITQCCVLAKERSTNTGNSRYLAAYYVLDGKEMSVDYEDIVESWEHLYDDSVYGSEVEEVVMEEDFSGWNAYVTDSPIPIPEMQAWKNNTLSIISGLNPVNVLEIGVGSGLLMYPLLADVQRYTGLDISKAVINRHQKYLENRQQRHTSLHHLKANQIDRLPEHERFDTIILNSVSQYFPGINYFEEVVEKALSRLSPGGSLFLGDIRNFDQLKSLIRDRLDYEGKNYNQQDLDQIALKENEFLLSPRYFLQMAEQYPQLQVEVMERTRHYDNELSRYRYDVVISLRDNAGTQPIRISGVAGSYNIPYLSQLPKEEILRQLSLLLPAYMIPAALVQMAALPLTVNGKLDKRALPDPDFNANPEGAVAPVTEAEKLLCSIWQEVLELNHVGITDDFFQIGGDSILSIRLVSKIKQAGYSLSVKDVFRYRTIQELLQNIAPADSPSETEYAPFSLISTELQEAIVQENDIELSQVQDIYPASYLQSGMLVDSYARNNRALYHDIHTFSINASFDREKFEQVWKDLIQKNEQLRTSFLVCETGYVNVVYHTVLPDARMMVCDPSTKIEQLTENEEARDFKLANPGIFRLIIIPGTSSFIFAFAYHHAIIDGWSLASIIAEFVDSYVHNQPFKTDFRPSYGKFIAKELKALQNNSYKKFWGDYLEGYEQGSKNLLSHPEPARHFPTEISLKQELPADTVLKITALARELKMSPDVIFMGVYQLVLSLFYNTNDLVTGTVVNNRLEEEGGDRVFGLHLNTIPMRFKTEPDKVQSAKAYFEEVFKNKLKVNEYGGYPYGKIKADLNLREDLYHCAFNYIHFHNAEENFENQSISTEDLSVKISIPFMLNVSRMRDTYTILLKSFPDFIDEADAERLLVTFITCMEQIAAHPDQMIKDLQLLPEPMFQQIVLDWNATDTGKGIQKTICRMFSEQVEKTPDQLALIFEEEQLTYRQLDAKSNQLARYLRKQYEQKKGQELQPDTLIGLFIDRSLEMVIGILGVLKAGAAYLPLDISYPQDRIDYLIEDAGTSLILSRKQFIETSGIQLPSAQLTCIDLYHDLYQQEDASELPEYSRPENLVYVLYTSGTTGRPKGVMLEHFSVCNRIEYMITCSEITTSDHFLFKTNYVFDVSFSDLFSHLCAGASLHLSKEVFDPEELKWLLLENKFTSLHLVPSQFELLAETINQIQLQKIYFSGEALRPKILSDIRDKSVRIYNYYGPTELGEITVFQPVTPSDASIIGKIFPNSRHYVLGPQRNPVPVGVAGELYVGGAGLARGYLNRTELTAERFIPNQFATAEDKEKGYTRLYKTGDLVRWLPDGNLEYIGRNDDQIKINGFRVELGEVEQVLAQVQGVQQSCVLCKERATASGHTKYLIGYYVPDPNGIPLSAKAVQNHLLQVLPEYMVPAMYVQLESFPLTGNGKLNKQALPDPDIDLSLRDNYVAPVTATEKEMCQIWQNLLGLTRIGICDHFFLMGGNSISAIQVSHLMSKALGWNIKVSDIFRLNTIEKILANGEQYAELVVPYQEAYEAGLSDMIFISPGRAGSEMYQHLTEQLAKQYNCIGIDNYNIRNEQKIFSLNKLAMLYLSAYEEKYALKEQISLLGWSLGGQIALEMAGILEQRGHKNIQVVLLDTFVKDEVMLNFDKNADKKAHFIAEENRLSMQYGAAYSKKIIAAIDAEEEIGKTSLSNYLRYSKVLLFKASHIVQGSGLNMNVSFPEDHYKSLWANNVDQVAENLKVIHLDCHHFNILDTNSITVSNYLLNTVSKTV